MDMRETESAACVEGRTGQDFGCEHSKFELLVVCSRRAVK